VQLLIAYSCLYKPEAANQTHLTIISKILYESKFLSQFFDGRTYERCDFISYRERLSLESLYHRTFYPGTLYRDIVLSLCEKHKEQAEVGRSPTLLALRYAAGVLRILRGYLRRFMAEKRRKIEYLAVFSIAIDRLNTLSLKQANVLTTEQRITNGRY